jgi:hypothetical protein
LLPESFSTEVLQIVFFSGIQNPGAYIRNVQGKEVSPYGRSNNPSDQYHPDIEIVFEVEKDHNCPCRGANKGNQVHQQRKQEYKEVHQHNCSFLTV